MPRRFSWTSLRTPLLLLVLLCTTPLVLLLALALKDEREERKQLVERQALAVAEAFARDQENLLESTERTLAALAELPTVRDSSGPASGRLVWTEPVAKPATATTLYRAWFWLSDVHLGLQDLVEGVETEEQLALFEEAGYSYAQGFLFATPHIIEGRRAQGYLIDSKEITGLAGGA